MKIVFDTNVLISGFLTVTGTSQYVLSLALKRHQVIFSEFILAERKRKLVDKLEIPKRRADRLIQFLRRRADILRVPANPKIDFPDKKDIPILSLIVASGAHYCVTGDKALLGLKKVGMTLMISPREALENL